MITTTDHPLTAEHRCDKCGAQAMIRATLVSGLLYFCGHHSREMGEKLISSSIQIYDPESVLTYANR